MLPEKQLEELRLKLEKAAQSIEAQLSKFAKEDTEVKGNYKSTFPDIGDHIDDNAQEVREYEQNISLEHNLETELKLIRKALKKIGSSQYGTCEECSKSINYERLKIRPQAIMCVNCKSKKETIV